MTVTAGPRQCTSGCNGATVRFSCPNFADQADIEVYLLDDPEDANQQGTRIWLGDDYTIDGTGTENDAEIVTNAAYPLGQHLRAWRNSAREQEADYTANEGFPFTSTEYELDRLTLVDAELADNNDRLEARSVRAPLGETVAPLAARNDRKGTMLGFSALTGVLALLSFQNLATVLAPLLQPMFTAIQKGDPGGNVMAIGTFLAGPTLNIPNGTNMVRSTGYSADARGGAFYQYDVGVNGAYVAAHPRAAFVSANGRGFRLSLDQQLNVAMFNAIGNDIANDGDAFVAANAFSYANAQDGTGFGKAGPSIMVPFGKYYLGGQTLDLIHTIEMFGDGGGAYGATAQLRWDDAVTGFRAQGNDTFGDIGNAVQPYPGSYGSILRNFYLKGGYAGVESDHHGILMRAKLELDNILIDNFPGDGIAGLTDAGMGGNANGYRFSRVWVRNCRIGTRVSGLNTNVGSARDCYWSDNRRWGVYDHSQIGNQWHGINENNGRSVGATPSMVAFDGGSGSNWYAVIAGQEAGAATHAPSGTTADNAYWYYCNPGPPIAQVPVWFNGVVVLAGGAARTDNAAANVTFEDYWTEYAQGPMQLVEPTKVEGGGQASGVRGISRMQKSQFGYQVEKLRISKQGLFGPSTGDPAANGDWIFENTLAHTLITFRRWISLVATTIDGSIMADANGLSLGGVPRINLLANSGAGDVTVGYIDVDGLHLNFISPASGIYMGTARVVRFQQGPIANDASGAPNQGTVNAILAVLRNGIIAP